MGKGKVLAGGSLLLLAAIALVGCSNGNSANNSGNGNTATPGQAQGVYAGTTSTGLTFNGIVLPNDMFYAIYGNMSGNTFYVCGMATGQGTSNNGKYTVSGSSKGQAWEAFGSHSSVGFCYKQLVLRTCKFGRVHSCTVCR